ncbi:hypothetical protein DL93DRAFT_1325072 [Clavulina sp. PMI_390]|nr:hypothetical protein DL93DRAFT_1325072 [Clavulina sp. PMI_390]
MDLEHDSFIVVSVQGCSLPPHLFMNMSSKVAIRKVLEEIEECYDRMAETETSQDTSFLESICEQLRSLVFGLQEAQNVLNNKLTRVQSRRSRAFNSQTRTVQLPPELLGEIFSHACHIEIHTSSYFLWEEDGISTNFVDQTRRSIGLTCAHWLEVLISTPMAWRNVIFKYTAPSHRDLDTELSVQTRILHRQLKHSKLSPCRFFIDYSKWRTHSVDENHDSAPIWASIINNQAHPEALCIRALNLSDPCTSLLFNTPLSIIPRLHLLRLELENVGDQAVLDLSGASQLRSLDVRLSYSSDNPLSLLCPPNLSEIRLWGPISVLDALRGIIQSTGTLQRLDWSSADILDYNLLPAPLGNLNFPQLLTLRVEISNSKKLFYKMSFPILETLALEFTPELSSGSITEMNKHCINSLRILEIKHEDTSWLLDCLLKSPSVELISLDCLTEAIVDQLIPFVSPEHPNPPSITAQGAYDPFPNLEIIHVTDMVYLMGVERLAIASQRRKHPFMILVVDFARDKLPLVEKEKLDQLLQEYPNSLCVHVGPLPAKWMYYKQLSFNFFQN